MSPIAKLTIHPNGLLGVTVEVPEIVINATVDTGATSTFMDKNLWLSVEEVTDGQIRLDTVACTNVLSATWHRQDVYGGFRSPISIADMQLATTIYVIDFEPIPLSIGGLCLHEVGAVIFSLALTASVTPLQAHELISRSTNLVAKMDTAQQKVVSSTERVDTAAPSTLVETSIPPFSSILVRRGSPVITEHALSMIQLVHGR